MLGASGTIGQATLRALLQEGHEVICFMRKETSPAHAQIRHDLQDCTFRDGSVLDEDSISQEGFQGEHFDVVVSCMASRTGSPKDAWDVDFKAHSKVLALAKTMGVKQFILLSAICVQKPLLEFQYAKLAFEKLLIESGLIYSIVRPTAFFKSLSGQIERVKKGKAFLVFGNGVLTSCKPISDADLGTFIANCIQDESRHHKILPIGGPGPAITPMQQGQYLFTLLNKPPKFKHVPVGLLDVIILTLSALGKLIPSLRDKCELAKIGRYYATESMLVLNTKTQVYDPLLTPEFGQDRLFDFYKKMIFNREAIDLKDHAVFK